MKTLHISAGGRGERISDYINEMGLSVPKHLLPIPTEGKTILGEIILGAKSHMDRIIVWLSTQNYFWGSELNFAEVRIDNEMTGPLGPMLRNLIVTKSRTFGCAGDFYCDFSWEQFEAFHNSHNLPISILVSRSVPVLSGAKFFLNQEKIVEWNRVNKTKESDQINIGCYIIDPDESVIEEIKTIEKHKEDNFFDIFISKGIIAGYDPGGVGFNINTPTTYKQLLSALK